MPSILVGEPSHQRFTPLGPSYDRPISEKRVPFLPNLRQLNGSANSQAVGEGGPVNGLSSNGTYSGISAFQNGRIGDGIPEKVQAPAGSNCTPSVAEGTQERGLVNGSGTGSNIYNGHVDGASNGTGPRPSWSASQQSRDLDVSDGTAELAKNGAAGAQSTTVKDEPPHPAPTLLVPPHPGPHAQELHGQAHPPPHRFSSPPAFRHTAASSSISSSLGSSNPPPGKLLHRHTLEVPQVSTSSRLSKEYTPSAGNPSEEVVFASGRFSPTTPRKRTSISIARRNTRSINSDIQLDGLPHDEDAVRWADHIRQKRASKRKKKEDEEDDRVVVGTRVDQNHVNWVTAYNMLTGIRFTVSRTNAKIDRELTDADFHARHKFSFDITGNELTPSAKYDFKFKDYAPWVFRHLRATFHIDPADYLMSLTSKYILSELGSPGKSGSFFYFSRDYKYIIKTIHHAEHKLLRRILRDYYDHVRDNPNTLLSQFYGLHRVKIPYGRKIHFVVMNNLFPPHRDIHRTFDLKGSTIGRDYKEEDLEKNPRATLKDLNWVRRNLHLEFGPTKRHAFIEQLKRDVQLLQRLEIMDYSLLVGIHDLARGNEGNLREQSLKVFQPGGDATDEHSTGPTSNGLTRTPSTLEKVRKAKELRQLIKQQRPIPIDQSREGMPEEILNERKDFYFYADDGGFRASHEDESPGEQIYYLGIIDCLTHYSLLKRMEHFFKGLTHPEGQISAIPPDRYGDRFLQFISAITKSREEALREKEEEGNKKLLRKVGEGILDDPILTAVNLHRGNMEAVIEKAERQAERTIQHGRNGDEPDRSVTALRQAGDGYDGDGGATLPVVEEAGENGSTASRSRNESPRVPESEAQQGEGAVHEGEDVLARAGMLAWETTSWPLEDEGLEAATNSLRFSSPAMAQTSDDSSRDGNAARDEETDMALKDSSGWRARKKIAPPRHVSSPTWSGEVDPEIMDSRVYPWNHRANEQVVN